MTTVLELTQSALRQVMKDNYDLKHRVSYLQGQTAGWENNAKVMQRSALKWKSMYEDLAEPLENAARYCAILPPKTMDGGSCKRPHEELEISHHITLDMLSREDTSMRMHVERLHWVQAMIYKDEFQNLVHYRLNFDNGKQLGYTHTLNAIRIQSKEFIMKEIAYQFTQLWYREIHDGKQV